MIFWDTGPDKSIFDFQQQKKDLIDNMNYLKSMSVQEQTLHKKWVELQEPAMIKEKSRITSLYDTQWKPTDINNLEQTVKEINDLEPYVEIVESTAGTIKWTYLRKMIHTMSWTANPGRNIKINVKDRNTGKVLGQISLASDVTSLAVRDKYIGWNKDDKFEKGKLNHTTIASTIVCTQPLGFNFLGGKLIAAMATSPTVRDHWKAKYGQTLIAVGTTSLYGIHSQYNGIPHFKTLGESAGKISIKPDDSLYEPWHKWLKDNHPQWYKQALVNDRIISDKDRGVASGPVSGIKQKMLSKIFKICNIKSSQYWHGFKRGVYLAMMYDNGCEFLRGEIDESDLVMKKKFEEGVEYISRWWKKKAIKRYTKLHLQGRLKPEHLYYIDVVGIDWETMRDKYLKEVGR
tara:strand:- start:354 stop:1562 length:1209 start_codon:yes stop_codon:yes gene_type:complete